MSLHIVVLLRRLLATPDGAPASRLVGACDRAALAAGLAVRGTIPGARVTVLAAGPAQQHDAALAWAVAAGADAAARVDDPALARIDALGLGRALAGAGRVLQAGLVLAGERSEDEAQGALGPATAEALGVVHVTGARKLEADLAAATVIRHDAGGKRTLRVPLPALICVASHPGPPLPDEPPARPVDIRVLDLATCGLSPAELRYRESLLGAPVAVRLGRSASMVRDADDLLRRLRADHLV